MHLYFAVRIFAPRPSSDFSMLSVAVADCTPLVEHLLRARLAVQK
jgi:hypothetical protein